MEGQIDTVAVDSVFEWLRRALLGGAPQVLRSQTPSGDGGGGRPGFSYTEINLLEAADMAVLSQVNTGAPDLAAADVVFVHRAV
jgi:hypothetical protein